jgi:hypothetical protein
MKRRVRLIWRILEATSEGKILTTFGTDCVILPMDCAGVGLQRDGGIPELVGCEWLGEEGDG